MLSNIRIYTAGFILILSSLSAQFSVSCDIASRYVWRGTDFGNSASIQPGISYAAGPLTIGAWSAWQHSGVGSENDIYASYAMGDFSLTVTDYYFPPADFTNADPDTGTHNIEVSIGGAFSGVGFTFGMFVIEPGFYGAYEDGEIPMSKYINLSYGPFMLGLGDGGYTTDGEFAPIELGVTASNDKYSCSWILNPDSGNAFLVVAMSL